jgi:RimJ/RimL family protein N-acetyltransferase
VTSGPPGPATQPRAADVVVRELRWSDFDDLTATYYLLYDEREVQTDLGISLFRTRPSREDQVTWFANLYRRVLSGETVAAIAERNGHAIGSCIVHCVGPSRESEMSHVGELGIVVHRDHRGTGVGTALLRRALEQCRGKFDLVRLSVFSVNVRARRLYEQFGFVFVGTIPRAVRRGNQSFGEDFMFLDLSLADGG